LKNKEIEMQQECFDLEVSRILAEMQVKNLQSKEEKLENESEIVRIEAAQGAEDRSN